MNSSYSNEILKSSDEGMMAERRPQYNKGMFRYSKGLVEEFQKLYQACFNEKTEYQVAELELKKLAWLVRRLNV